MNITEKEKRLFILFFAFVFITAILPGFGLQFANSSLAEAEQLENQLRSEIVNFQTRLSGAEGERETIRANREDYLRWVDMGVVGEQDPVKWVKAMEDIQKTRNFFDVGYDFSDQVLQEPSVSPFTEDGSVMIRLWDMQLEMAMLHDLDTLMFLENLEQKVDSFFFPIECRFSLTAEDFSLESRPNMVSACNLTWVSVEDPEKTV